MTNLPSVDYERLFNTLPGRYIVFAPDDPDYTIIAISNAHAEALQVKREDIIGKPLMEAFPDTSDEYQETGKSKFLESLRKVIKTKKPMELPTLRYDITSPDNKVIERHWSLKLFPLLGKDKKIQAVFQEVEDITEELTVGLKLRQIQEQLQEALLVGQMGTWIWDIKQDIVIGDKYMASMYGVNPDDAAKGLPVLAFINAIHPEDRDRVTKEIARAVEDGDVYETEYRSMDAEGAIRWLIARGRVERNSKGEPMKFPGALVDITERKHIENNLRFLTEASAILSSSLDYSQTLNSIAQLVVPDIADWCSIDIIDEKGAVRQLAVAHKDPAKVKWAKELRERQGAPDMTESSGIGKVLRTGELEYLPYIPDEVLKVSARSDEDYAIIKQLGLKSAMIVPLRSGKKIYGAITFVSAEQKRQFSEIDLAMAKELANRSSMAIVNAYHYKQAQKEIAARKKLEEALRFANTDLERRVAERTIELNETNTSLQRSNQELQDFAYVASHDLQEPLRKIQAFGNLLEEEYGKQLGDGKDYLERMRSAAARMSALIEDILAFSRVTTKAREFTKVDLNIVAKEVLEDLETRIDQTKATIELDNLPSIKADPMQMRQLLQNLIANALKFHKPNVPPVVKIKAVTEISQTTKIKYTKLSIEDNGVGFDEKYLDRIFAVFQRLHARDSYGGTGIGLAVCRKIVERHGGTITAISKPGEGAIFIATLPMQHKKGETL